ncbi:MAG: histidine kinase dimerization/phosphoacceptor domain -containing protein [Devosia sp.]
MTDSLEIVVDESARLAAVRRYDILDTPPDGSFDRITALAASLFRVPISIISLVDHDRVWFKSRHGLEGVTQIGTEPGLCASAIVQNDPWVLENAATDIRSLTNPLVAGEFGLRFYAGIPLTTSDGYNLGTLCVIDREPRTVTDEQIGQLRHLASVVMDQMELRMSARTAVGELSDALETARLLGQEIDHRVMNSLQLVSSMLQLQGRQLKGYEAAEELRLAGSRVASVARVHQHIFKNQNAGIANSKAYLEDLVGELRTMLDTGRAIVVEAEAAPLSADVLVPIGLVLNELVINGTKYGVGDLLVEFKQLDSGNYCLSVSNDGEALPADFDPRASQGLGMKVVAALAHQLGGDLQFGPRLKGSGARFWVEIPSGR